MEKYKYLLEEIKRCDGLQMKLCLDNGATPSQIDHIQDRKDWLYKELKQEIKNIRNQKRAAKWAGVDFWIKIFVPIILLVWTLLYFLIFG